MLSRTGIRPRQYAWLGPPTNKHPRRRRLACLDRERPSENNHPPSHTNKQNAQRSHTRYASLTGRRWLTNRLQKHLGQPMTAATHSQQQNTLVTNRQNCRRVAGPTLQAAATTRCERAQTQTNASNNPIGLSPPSGFSESTTTTNSKSFGWRHDFSACMRTSIKASMASSESMQTCRGWNPSRPCAVVPEKLREAARTMASNCFGSGAATGGFTRHSDENAVCSSACQRCAHGLRSASAFSWASRGRPQDARRGGCSLGGSLDKRWARQPPPFATRGRVSRHD